MFSCKNPPHSRLTGVLLAGVLSVSKSPEELAAAQTALSSAPPSENPGSAHSTLIENALFFRESQLPFIYTDLAEQLSEVASLRRLYTENVQLSSAIPDSQYSARAGADALSRLTAGPPLITPAQYFVYVDRAADQQRAFIGFYSPDLPRVEIIGWARVSTGNPRRFKHFLTPTGVFENTLSHPSYRALGTKNDKGWRGLGRKNSRVWDFGYQNTTPKKEGYHIRLLMHATDPDQGEPRLGTRDSQGCVRIPAKFNDFLDLHGLLDRHYLEHASEPWPSVVLRRDRTAVKWPGSFIIVGDSSAATN